MQPAPLELPILIVVVLLKGMPGTLQKSMPGTPRQEGLLARSFKQQICAKEDVCQHAEQPQCNNGRRSHASWRPAGRMT